MRIRTTNNRRRAREAKQGGLYSLAYFPICRRFPGRLVRFERDPRPSITIGHSARFYVSDDPFDPEEHDLTTWREIGPA